MAYTLTQLQAEVRRWLSANNDAEFDAAFPGFVRQAEEKIYGATRIQPYRQIATIELDAGVYYFRCPTNYVGMISMSLVAYGSEEGGEGSLIQKNTDWLTEAIPSTATGKPLFYAIQGTDQDCVLAPRPDQDVMLIFEYFGKPASLTEVAADQTTWVSRNAEGCLLQGTLYFAYLFEKGEDDMTAKYKGEFDAGLQILGGVSQILMRGDDYKASPQAAKG